MAIPKIIQIPIGDQGALQYHYVAKRLSSAQILTSNSVPIEIVTAPGAGIILMPFLIIGKTNYGTITYATNLTMKLRWNSVVASLPSISLGRTENYIQTGNTLASDDVLGNYENQNLTLKTDTGDPTAGDGTMDIYLWYIKLTL